jgi:hypothetical protein
MLEKLRKLAVYLNDKGFILPWIRDPKTGTSSVSLTMMMISFFIVVFGLIGKMSKTLDINLTEALTLLGVTASLYFGRKIFPGSETVQQQTTTDTTIVDIKNE